MFNEVRGEPHSWWIRPRVVCTLVDRGSSRRWRLKGSREEEGMKRGRKGTQEKMGNQSTGKYDVTSRYIHSRWIGAPRSQQRPLLDERLPIFSAVEAEQEQRGGGEEGRKKGWGNCWRVSAGNSSTVRPCAVTLQVPSSGREGGMQHPLSLPPPLPSLLSVPHLCISSIYISYPILSYMYILSSIILYPLYIIQSFSISYIPFSYSFLQNYIDFFIEI